MTELVVGGDEGEWPNGTRVRKIGSKLGDAHQDGDEGVLVGAFGPISPATRAQVLLALAREGHSVVDAIFFYWVVWDDMPGVPVMLLDGRIESVEGDQPPIERARPPGGETP